MNKCIEKNVTKSDDIVSEENKLKNEKTTNINYIEKLRSF